MQADRATQSPSTPQAGPHSDRLVLVELTFHCCVSFCWMNQFCCAPGIVALRSALFLSRVWMVRLPTPDLLHTRISASSSAECVFRNFQGRRGSLRRKLRKVRPNGFGFPGGTRGGLCRRLRGSGDLGRVKGERELTGLVKCAAACRAQSKVAIVIVIPQ